MDKIIIITGCGTSIGKTVASAIITTALEGDYWKPIQSGDFFHSDSEIIKNLLQSTKSYVHSSAYQLQAPLSPHHAAKLEGIEIDIESITLPSTKRTLVIETVGGVLVPLRTDILALDFFKKWKAKWIVVSNNYLGSINHTLLTIEALHQRNIVPSAIVFNGAKNKESEAAILYFSKISSVLRMDHEAIITEAIIKKYANQWKEELVKCIQFH